MAETDYLNFDLRIEREGQAYPADVLDSPAGQASAGFVLPFSDLELEKLHPAHEPHPARDAAHRHGSTTHG